MFTSFLYVLLEGLYLIRLWRYFSLFRRESKLKELH